MHTLLALVLIILASIKSDQKVEDSHSTGDKYHNEFKDAWPPPFKTASTCGQSVVQPPHMLISNPAQGKISSPFQSQHLPLPSSATFPVTTSTIFPAANSGSNSFSFGTVSQNSRLKSVLTVPGW